MINQKKIIWNLNQKNVRKTMTKKILFCDDEAGIYCKTQFSHDVMVELRICYKRVTRRVIIKESTINSERYMNEILGIALEDSEKC